jgi:hypothetical protein
VSRDDGGQAFPHTQHRSDRDHQWQETIEGMSLRDYIATNVAIPSNDSLELLTAEQAAAIGCPFPTEDKPAGWMLWAAAVRSKLRYVEADAMIAERNRTP